MSSLCAVLLGCSENEGESFLAFTTLTDIQLVDSLAWVNIGFPLGFDSQGEPHLAYLRRDPGAPSWAYSRQILHAYRTAGAWQHEIAVRNGDFMDGLNLGFQPSQEPFVIFQRDLSGYAANLEIASRAANGYWSEATIDSDGWAGWSTSIQTLPSGDIRIAYSAGYPYYDLRYAERIAGIWATTTVESIGDAGYFPCLASTENGDPIIVSYQFYSGLQLAQRSGGIWSTKTLVPEGNTCALAMDEAGNTQMVYGETTPGGRIMKYALRMPSGAWQHELIANQELIHPSLVLDGDGTPWFVFMKYDGAQYHIAIGAGHGGDWFVKELPEAGPVNAVTLNRTPDGRLGVAYTTTGDRLYFAWVQP